jgi:hypothetical protein
VNAKAGHPQRAHCKLRPFMMPVVLVGGVAAFIEWRVSPSLFATQCISGVYRAYVELHIVPCICSLFMYCSKL